LIKNATVSFYKKTKAKNNQGTWIETFGYLLTTPTAADLIIRADVQPHKLTTAQREIWGISDKNSNVKIMFSEYNSSLVDGTRVSVVSDFDGTTNYYEVKPVNSWPNHAETLLVPVQGE
jgi:hypothetical protein